MLQLFGYWRSSASFRVRLVLQLKGLGYEQHPVNLRQGEQKEKAYRRVNPQGLVPFLIDGDVQLGQSVAIMEYLDETYPAYPLMQGESVNILLNFTQFFETRIEYRFQIFTAHSCDFLLPSYARLA